MTERSVVVRLRAEVAGFTSQMKVAQQSVADFSGKTGKWALDNKRSLDDVALKAGIAGAALTGLAGVAVARFADFDQAMSGISAVTAETADNMAALRQAALDAGRDTQYSALEAAGGIEELAKAGVSTADILDGGLTGALALAAAGGVDVADAAETAASAMVQFGLSGADVPHIADLLAQAANVAQGGVTDMAYALSEAGLTASGFGVSVEDTVGVLTSFANSGLIGSSAGTVFKQMLLRLAAPSKEAAGLMKDLGIAAYDAEGNFVGVTSLAEQLQQRLGGLTQAQRDSALATLFGSRAIQGAQVFYREGAQGIQGYIDSVNVAGAASDVAAERMNNLRGDLTFLGGSVETLLIKMGSAADGPLRGLVQGVSGVVNKLSEMPPAAQGATLAITGGGGLALLSIAAMAKLTTFVAETGQSLKNLGIDAGKAKRALSGIGKGIVIGAVIFEGTRQLAHFMDEWKRARGLILESDGLVRDVDIFGSTGKVVGQLADLKFGVEQFGLAIETLENQQGGLFGAGGALSPANYIAGFSSDVRAAKETVQTLDQALSELYQTDPSSAEAAFRRIQVAAADAGYPIYDLSEQYFPAYNAELERAAAEADAAADGVTDFAGELPPITEDIEEQAEALKELNDQFFELASQFLDARAAERALADAIDAFNAVMDDSESTAREREAAMDAVAEAQLRVAEGMYADGEGIDAVNARLPDLRDQLQVVADRFFGAGDEADNFVNTVLDAEGLSVDVPVSVPGVDASIEALDAVADAVLRIPRTWQVDVYTRYTQTGLSNKLTYNSPSFNADGGFIRGPGGPRDDAIPSWLSNGEYVLAADAVARLGVPFLDALNSGRMYGFAQGGYVGRRAPETAVRSETISIGQVVAHDYNDFRRQLDREKRLSALPGAMR